MAMNNITFINPGNDIQDARIGIVCSRFNRFIVERLQEACIEQLVSAGIHRENITLVQVPGAFEIPVAVQRMLNKRDCDAVITLGAVIRGETPHFEYIASECARGIAGLALENDVPVIFGVLTVDNREQAEQRAGTEESNKGAESARAALHMISIMRRI